jgi:hypothetical protein
MVIFLYVTACSKLVLLFVAHCSSTCFLCSGVTLYMIDILFELAGFIAS